MPPVTPIGIAVVIQPAASLIHVPKAMIGQRVIQKEARRLLMLD
jgi:hypothetical protein